MTTIIATRELMVSDTKCDYHVPFRISKIFRIGDVIYGGAGSTHELERFLEWKRGGEKPSLSGEEEWCVLELSRDGLFMWMPSLTKVQIKSKFYAIGSGAQYAIGAMECGVEPKDAIRIAAKYDSGTELPLETMKLEG
jgi:20S proteasome alpha/beta subunit